MDKPFADMTDEEFFELVKAIFDRYERRQTWLMFCAALTAILGGLIIGYVIWGSIMTKKHHTPEERAEHAAWQAEHDALVRAGNMFIEQLEYCEAYTKTYEQYQQIHTELEERATAASDRMVIAPNQKIGLSPGDKSFKWIMFMFSKIFPEDTIERIEMEIEFEKTMILPSILSLEANADEFERQKTQRQLAVAQKPGLILPGK